MVVVGGRSSANTKELTRLCEIAGTPAIQIEGVARPDRPDRRSRGASVVGVTGGTSTPIEDLRDVAEAHPRAGRHARGPAPGRRAGRRRAGPSRHPGRPHDLAPEPHRRPTAGAA